MIKYEIERLSTLVRQWFFPDGCVGVNLNIGEDEPNPERMDIFVTLTFGDTDSKGKPFSINDDLIALGLTVDALRAQYPMATLFLGLPYMPYARQDRICSPGDSFSLRYVAKMINGMGFATVTVADPHSGITGALLDNLFVVHQHEIFGNVRDFSDVYIVAPDQGAAKKCEDFGKRVGALGVVTCAKVREMSTGKIIGFRVMDEVIEGANYFVLDDICDGGRTFIEVANALTCSAEIGNLELAITHGLFTQGTGVLTKLYDKVYTTDSYTSDKTDCEVLALL